MIGKKSWNPGVGREGLEGKKRISDRREVELEEGKRELTGGSEGGIGRREDRET